MNALEKRIALDKMKSLARKLFVSYSRCKMTIKHKLIISHVVVFIVPVMMTALVITICGLGLMIFARNGNHIYVESAWEFQHAC